MAKKNKDGDLQEEFAADSHSGEDTGQPAANSGEDAPENLAASEQREEDEGGWPAEEGPWPPGINPPASEDIPVPEDMPEDAEDDSVWDGEIPVEIVSDEAENHEADTITETGDMPTDAGEPEKPEPEETPKKTTRRRATAVKPAEAIPAASSRKRATAKKAAADEKLVVEESASDDPPAQPAIDPVESVEKSLADRKREAALQCRERRREREHSAILDVDGTSLVEDSDGFDEKAAAVFQAANTRTICCGPITGVKFARGTGHYVEAEYKGFRVLIPFQEMDIVLERQPSDSDNDYENKTITAIRNMVGAEIEFVILDIDENEQLALATRRQATEQRRREVLNGVNRNGENHIYPTRKVVARVLDVHPFYAWVEVAGWRTRLSASELRAEYVEDMTTELANGQRVTVTITELTRDRQGNVTDMRISMRDDEKEKRDLEKAMAGINIGDIIRCEVVGRSAKDVLRINGGNITVTAVNDGLRGRDGVEISDGVFAVEAGNDGIKSNNDSDPEKGYVTLSGGSYHIISGHDAVQAETVLTVSGGSYAVTSGGGFANALSRPEEDNFGRGGSQSQPQEEDDSASNSSKGFKAARDLTITGGTFQLDTQDDAVHANENLIVTGGSFTIETGDDAFHADYALRIEGGEIDVQTCYEGLEGMAIELKDGVIHIRSIDDSIGAAGGADDNANDWDRQADENLFVRITGGEIETLSGGDSIDSNGYVYLDGGTIRLNGPSRTFDGAIVCNGDITITGGVITGVGSVGAVGEVSNGNAQNCILLSHTSPCQEGSVLSLRDVEGNILMEHTALQEYSESVLSSPALMLGETYTLYIDNIEMVAIKLSETVTRISDDGGEYTGGFRWGRNRYVNNKSRNLVLRSLLYEYGKRGE